MSLKESKAILKNAKECIDKKDFATAMIHCKTVLKEDRNNYVALVLLGACIQESDQPDEAYKAFKKAISLSPEQPLAWKGLASFYEKKNRESDREDLLKVYTHLLVLETDGSKISDWLRKIGILLSILGSKAFVDFWNALRDLKSDHVMTDVLKMLLYNMAVEQFALDEALEPLANVLMETRFENDDNNKHQVQIYKKFISLKYKRGNLKEVIAKAVEMFGKFPDIVSGPEWFCRSYIELTAEEVDNLPDPKPIFTQLFEFSPDSYLAHTCKGIYEMANNDFLSAVDSFTQSVFVKPSYGFTWYYLMECEAKLHRFEDAVRSSREALKLLNQKLKKLLNRCRLLLVLCSSELEERINLQDAVNIGEELFWADEERNDELTFALSKAAYKLGQMEKYNKFTESLINKHLIHLLTNGPEKVDILENSKEELSNCYRYWLELGKIYYEQKKTASCLNCLLKAAKLNQWCPWIFFYLGNCYKTLLNDLTKARRCYQKAFQLNPKHADSGICLSDIFRIQGMQEENMNLLNIAQKMPGVRWPFLKLGLHYLSINQPIKAIRSLTVAVRQNAEDLNGWESLADAYVAQGSYTAALKAYQKVLELDPNLIYPLLQIATVKCRQGFYEESVAEFRQVLQRDSNFLPALKGHAEACVLLMKERLALNLNGLAMDSCQEAVNSLSRILEEKRDIVCVWKLFGDALILTAKLPVKWCKIRVPFWLWQSQELKHIEYVELLHKDILHLAVRCFCQAVSLHSKSSELWLDLAFCYNTIADVPDTEEEGVTSRYLALSAVYKSLSLNPDLVMAWNLLGVLFASKEINNNAKAQHSFIKAIQLDENLALSWSNLGNLYLKLNDLKLANQAFGEAQRCDPDYALSWIGQGMVAELMEYAEAMDLYRHSAQLKFHPQGALGYSYLVCRTLLTTQDKSDPNYVYAIENMDAISVAYDLLTWYTEKYPADACALNMLGILSERLKLLRTSLKSFKSAWKSLEATSDASQQICDKVLLNLGRVQVASSEIDDGLKSLAKIKEATFENQCVLADAYLRAKNYEGAYETYNSALSWLAPDDAMKSHILVAMAAVLYLHQELNDAKILLMQACQLKPVSVAGLFSCCALGLLHDDTSLSLLVLNELNSYQNNPTYLYHVALFQTYALIVLKREFKEAVRVLSKNIHRHPANAELRLLMTRVLLYFHSKEENKELINVRSAMKCARSGLILSKSAIEVSKVLSLAGLSHLLSKEMITGLRMATKAVHMYPDAAENWLVFIATVIFYYLNYHHEKTLSDRLSFVQNSIQHVKNNLVVSTSFREWLNVYEGKIDLLTKAI